MDDPSGHLPVPGSVQATYRDLERLCRLVRAARLSGICGYFSIHRPDRFRPSCVGFARRTCFVVKLGMVPSGDRERNWTLPFGACKARGFATAVVVGGMGGFDLRDCRLERCHREQPQPSSSATPERVQWLLVCLCVLLGCGTVLVLDRGQRQDPSPRLRQLKPVATAVTCWPESRSHSIAKSDRLNNRNIDFSSSLSRLKSLCSC